MAATQGAACFGAAYEFVFNVTDPLMDAGNNGVVILADRMLPPRTHGVMISGPQSDAAELAFEKDFLWEMRHGHVKLP